MEKAKAAISDFMSKSGKHDTTVHETVAPAVQNETVKPTQHEQITTATDREVHQDHYHTSVQPIKDREVLPEKHTHNFVPVEHRHHEHGNEADVKRRLETEAAQFRDTTQTASTQHTQSVQPTVAGEHIHHHVHEKIQPVIHKETIQPNVVHTTVPIHEVHHNAAQHHSTSALPAMSMSDFQKQGGVLAGREEKYDGFEGQPKSIGKSLGSHFGTHGQHDNLREGTTGTGSGLTGTTGEHHHGTHGSGLAGSSTGTGLTGSHSGSGLTGSHSGSGLTGSTGHTTGTTTGTTTSNSTTGGLNSNVPSSGLRNA